MHVCTFAGLNICLLEAHLTPCSAWQCFVWFKSFAATRWFSCHDAVGPSLAIGRGEMPVVCIGTVLGNRRMCVCAPHVGVNRISSSPTLALVQRRCDYASGTSFSAKASFSEFLMTLFWGFFVGFVFVFSVGLHSSSSAIIKIVPGVTRLKQANKNKQGKNNSWCVNTPETPDAHICTIPVSLLCCFFETKYCVSEFTAFALLKVKRDFSPGKM